MIKETGRRVDAILRLVGSTLIGTSVLLLFLIAIAREVLGVSQDYLSDFTVWMVVWSFLLLLGPTYRAGEHVSIGVIFERLTGKARLVVTFFNTLCTLLFGLIVAVGGVYLVHSLIASDQTYARIIRVPMWIAQVCVPIGGISLAVYAGLEMWQLVKSFRPGQSKGAED